MQTKIFKIVGECGIQTDKKGRDFKISVAKGARVVIKENLSGESITVRLKIDGAATVDYIIHQSDGNALRTATLGRNSEIKWFDIQKNNHTEETKNQIVTLLNEEGSSVKIFGLFDGKKKDQYRIIHKVEHRAANTKSNIEVRGALRNSSSCCYDGLIKILAGATGCAGRLAEHTLLLSNSVFMEAVPNLEIGNNDVQCSHSVSAVRLDKKKGFYMQSRGLSYPETEKMLLAAHFNPIRAAMNAIKV